MATITGILADFRLLPMYGLSPEIQFIPSGNAVKDFGSVLYATNPIIVTPVEGTGAWTVDLADTDHLRPATWYTVVIVWQDAAGNYVRKDFVPGRLYVPTGGGAFTDLFRVGGNPLMVWIQPDTVTPPPNAVPGDLVLDPITDNLYQVS